MEIFKIRKVRLFSKFLKKKKIEFLKRILFFLIFLKEISERSGRFIWNIGKKRYYISINGLEGTMEGSMVNISLKPAERKRGGRGWTDNPSIIRESFSGMNRSIDLREYNWKSCSFALVDRVACRSQPTSPFPVSNQRVNQGARTGWAGWEGWRKGDVFHPSTHFKFPAILIMKVHCLRHLVEFLF